MVELVWSGLGWGRLAQSVRVVAPAWLTRPCRCHLLACCPSPLQIYGSVLQTLNHDPRIGVVSPSLIGTTGTVPLTVFSLCVLGFLFASSDRDLGRLGRAAASLTDIFLPGRPARIPDIIAHHATLIRGAQDEVLLFTNYWQISDSQRTISDVRPALAHLALILAQTVS